LLNNPDQPVLEGIRQTYEKITGSTRGLHVDDRISEDLDLDSLAALELLVDIEERFQIRIFDDPRAQKLATVGDLVALVKTIQQTASA
jgi:acyl carrier protein